MATSQISLVIQHLRTAALEPEGAGLTDAQLLESFVSRHETTALEVLVRRHGSMVWGVCCRMLRNHHDAEDAFQATFLVLLRKAGSVRPKEMVGSWLYGVAHQTALKAKATRAKRRMREAPQTTMPEPAVVESELWNDLQPVLDRELSLLPDKYRAVIVLCDLEGKSRQEAARQLGCPEGTVGSRLARARTLLAKRLGRHGLPVSGGALAAALSPKVVSAGVPTSVVASTIKAVTLVGAGQAVAAGTISVNVVALTEGVMKAMLLTKLKSVMAGLLVIAAVGFGGSLCWTLAAGPGEQESQLSASQNAAEKKATQDKMPATGHVYHADPEHLWNRLHDALFVRIGPDGRAYGQDRLEPLLWPASKHLLEEPSHQRAALVLEEFLKKSGEKLIEDPLKRAVLQRDLWLVFNWLEGDHRSFEEPAPKPAKVQEARERLARPLAAVIARLALTPDQIKKLPDNYAAAVASGEFARRFDPERPDKPFLPDLFAADGGWVCVGRPDGPVAPRHLDDDGSRTFTNSAFLLFLRLPAGRAATLDYLKHLRSFDQPLLVEIKDTEIRPRKYMPNPQLPPLPVGTEVALVRRALLIASGNTPTATALTESVQLRVYREVPAITPQTLRAALVGNTAEHRQAQAWQSFHEFRLSRALLFAGRAGGLHAAGPEEWDFRTGFGSHHWDEFDYRPPSARSFPEWNQHPITGLSCSACHSLPGVSSFNSFFHYRANLEDPDAARPFTLAEMPVSEVAGAAVKWKEGRPSWTALRKLLTN
jgi:RNA polymerase sigma factor (sigma-70 family)